MQHLTEAIDSSNQHEALDSSNQVLRAGDVYKHFGGTQALNGAGLEVNAGSIHALIGGNGSGKSTLIKCVAGVYQADSGSCKIFGKHIDLTKITPVVAADLGLRFVHQDLGIFPSLSIADNLFLQSRRVQTRLGRINRRKAAELADDVLGRFGLDVNLNRPAGELSAPQRALIAIARTLLLRPRSGQLLLVLDEPTATLSLRESKILFDSMRQIALGGDAVLYVTHRMDEVREIADTVTVFRDGRRVGSESVKGLTNKNLAEMIVGRSESATGSNVPDGAGKEKFQEGRVHIEQDDKALLTVKRLQGGIVRDVSLTVHEGEVVGLAGLVGSGRSEVLRMIFGLHPRSGGQVLLNGKPLDGKNCRDARQNGVVLISEDRLEEGVFPSWTIRDNLVVGAESDYFRWGRWRSGQVTRDATEAVQEYNIRCYSIQSHMNELSGGNQQKVILARLLRLRPTLLLLDEPTQGVDVGARAEIYDLIRQRALQGMGVLIVSSELEELPLICDRVVTIWRGRSMATWRQPMTEGELIAAALGQEGLAVSANVE
ncbi:MAG: sugar ABC transporter ATP-binding protein [Acidimicrobiaceae bacterium]|nr:sugar ABC transporter ATP-binding protein [Acidimicrobiaceae bacterium]